MNQRDFLAPIRLQDLSDSFVLDTLDDRVFTAQSAGELPVAEAGLNAVFAIAQGTRLEFAADTLVKTLMDFNYSEENEAFRQEFRAWLRVNAPVEPMQSLAGGFEQDEEDWQRKLNWYRKLAAAGWTCVDWPQEFGGRGLSILKTVIYTRNCSALTRRFPLSVRGVRWSDRP